MLKEESQEKLFRAYITDALMIIAENTTHFVGAKEMFDYGKSLNSRWLDLAEPDKKDQKKEPKKLKEDTRTAEEFAQDIWNRMRKK
jgi:hypothetical protein